VLVESKKEADAQLIVVNRETEAATVIKDALAIEEAAA